ncbi:MAG TPA: toll/interleukin-1 receptor domain-containing protein [Anaerolineae bacterium]|nr:toll/interleukin-1 receptor domain-containing protein [Anaerolineae bacterium]
MLSIEDWNKFMERVQPELVPHIFISYSHSDQTFAKKLAQDLQQKGGNKVWLDLWEIQIGDSIIEKIEEGIKESDFLVIVLSPKSVSSPWVKEELNSALTKQLNQQTIKVLPALIEDCEIPVFLSHRQYADFRPGSDYDKTITKLLKAVEPSLVAHVDRNDNDMISVASGLGIVIDYKRFAELLYTYFDLEEFKSLCFSLEENYDDLRGETFKRNVEELIMKLKRQDRLFELVDLVKEERPNAPWDDIYFNEN